MSRTIRAGLPVLTILLVAGCSDPAPSADASTPQAAAPATVFRFSAIPDEKPTEQRARFDPVAAHLAAELGVAVEYLPVNRYSASVQAFKNGDVHAAWFGGLSGVQARLALPGARAIAQGAEDPDFRSYFIANRSTGLAASEEFPQAIRALDFSFGSEGSTSGRLMPEYFIRKFSGAEPAGFFSEVGFSGNHPATLALVDSGAFDVGALNYRVYDDAPPEDKANTFVLWRTPPYPDYHFTIRGDLDATFGEGFSARLERTFLALPPDLCERSFGRSRMIPAKNADYDGIREVAVSLGLAR